MRAPTHAANDRLRFTLLALGGLCSLTTVAAFASLVVVPMGAEGTITVGSLAILSVVYLVSAYLHLERVAWFRALLFSWWLAYPSVLVALYRDDYPSPTHGTGFFVIGCAFTALVLIGHFIFSPWSRARWWVAAVCVVHLGTVAGVAAVWATPGVAVGITGAIAIVTAAIVLSCWTWQDDFANGAAASSARREEADAALRLARCADDSKSAFIASMSHELRTPLTAVLGYIEASIEDFDEGALTVDGLEADLATVQRAALGLLVDIDALLDVSKVEDGTEIVEVRPVDVERVIQRCIERVRPMARKKSLRLTSSVDPQSCTLITDEKRLQHVLMNLIGNAVKFTDVGGIDVVVTRTPVGMRLEVNDTGVGIHPSELSRVFDRFERTEAAVVGRTVGSGLGLAIASAEVARLGGVLTVSSVLGEGSSFQMDLPLEELVA